MLKFTVIVLLSAAFAYGQQEQFSPDKLVRYDYEGQLLTGIPGTSQEYAGLKIKCKILLQYDLDVVRMLLSEVSLKHLQQKLEQPLKKQTDSNFVDLSEKELRKLTAELQKPIQFQYRAGLISEIEASGNEPQWSINMRRGILNLLQVNLEGGDSTDNPINVNKIKRDELQQDRLFSVIEEGVSGECESQYVIKPWTSIPEYNNGQLTEIFSGYNVTKVVNYDNCVDRSMSSTAVMRGFKCALCENQKLLRSNGLIRLNITRALDDVVIDSVVAEGQHVFTPYSTEDGGIVTFINQTLKLVSLEREVIPVEQLIQEPENKQLKGGLKFVFQTIGDQVTPSVASDVVTEKEVTYLLKLLVGNVLEDELTETTPGLFLQLVQRLKKCSQAQLEDLVKVFSKEKPLFREQKEVTDKAVYEMERMMFIKSRKFLRDALPLVDTKAAHTLIKTLIEEKEISGDDAQQILASLALTQKPTQLFVNSTMELCKSEAVKEDVQLNGTCLLSFGSLVNTICNGQEQVIKCQPWVKEHYKQFLLAGIKKTELNHVKQIYLKAIGNAGLIETLDKLKQLIENNEAEVELRVNAVYALRRLTITQSSKIRTILIPVFLNQTNAAELRIAAYYIVMETKPSLAVVEIITEALRKETNNQVGNFVFSHLTSVSNSTIPCHRNVSLVVKQALRFAKPYNLGAQFSKHIVIGKMLEDLKLGAFLELNHIGQKDSPFPLSGNTKLSVNILGYQTSLVEAGLRMESLRYIIDTALGTTGESSPANDVIDKLLPIKKRDKDQDPKLFSYFKLFGNEIHFASLDKLIIDSFIKRSKIRKAFSVGKESVGVEMEMKTKRIPVTSVPSAPRFPLSGPVDFNITTRSGIDRPEQYLFDLKLSTVNVSSKFIKDSMKMNKFRQWITSSSSSSEEMEPNSVEASWGLNSRSHEVEWAFVPAWEERIKEAKQNSMGKDLSKSRSGSLELDDMKLSRSHEENTESRLATRAVLTIVGNNAEGSTDTSRRKIVTELLINHNEEGFKSATLELIQSPIKAGSDRSFMMCMQSEILFPVPDFVLPNQLRKRQDSVFNRFGRPSRYFTEGKSFSDEGSDASTSHSGQADSVSNLKSGESWSSSESGASGKLSVSDSSEERVVKHLSLEDKVRIMTKQIRSKLNLQWGVSCQNDKKLEIKARFEQSKKQLEELKDKQNPVLIQCNKDRESGLRYSPACLEIIQQENELREMHVMITYDNLPLWLKKLYSKSVLLLEKATMDKLVIENVGQKNKGGEVLISGALDKTKTKMDLAIRHPFETLRWHDVPLPVHIEPFSARYPLFSQYKQTLTNNNFPPTCKVVKDQIKTFDDLSYKYNITTCPHVIAKDCSSSERYTVTARQSPGQPEKKEVKIISEGKTIELKPLSDIEITVSLDGVPLKIKDNQKILIFSKGSKRVEAIFPHMDKIDALTKHPSESLSASASSEERHIADIMDEELAKINVSLTLPNVTVSPRLTLGGLKPSTDKPRPSEEGLKSKESKSKESNSKEVDSLSMSREQHEEREIDIEERKYWQDFRHRMKTMTAVDRPKSGRVTHVIRRMNETIEVECVAVGLKVKYNQRYIKTQVSPWYHGLQCGLCGEYDGEKTNDLVGPEQLAYRDSQIFGISYRVRDANLCSLDPEVANCLPKMKTIVIDDVVIDNIGSTCFSKIPVPKCDCTPTEIKQELLEFACMEKDSDESIQLKQRVASNLIVTEVSKLKTDFVSLTDSHLKCSQ
ncbi:vitellogenin-4-like [Anneissia japonica]|uniref:vitellogenin-4-like n=1 Tax=Anneissia japonica TaxID=1529436 RepID=UPI00142584D4|nr:vitellogenin-4-like [Anneissia japonica]